MSKTLIDDEFVRIKNVGDYFLKYSQAVRPWLIDLADAYKERGEFPMFPLVVLPSYYTDSRDREIAMFAALLLKNDAEYDQIQEFRTMLGNEPWQWFVQRQFVRLGIGRVQDKRTGGVLNWKIANLFSKIWDECHVVTVRDNFVRDIGTQLENRVREQHCSYFDMLTLWLEDCSVGDFFYKLRLLLMIFGASGGFSLRLWVVDPSELKSPITSDLRTFLSTFFPDYRRFGTVDDAINKFGFDRDSDFFYAFLAYKELQKRNPKACSEFATTYLRWYWIGAIKKPYQMREILPKI